MTLLPPLVEVCNQTLAYDNRREPGHEYSARDDFHQSELKMEAASTGVTLHFPNQSPNAG